MTDRGEPDSSGGDARPGRDPVRRRLGRRHAARRRPLHGAVSAAFGNDLATLPNFPAEIRAPAGTIAGVSSFQVHISDHDIVDAGRHAQRARRDEPGRAEGEPPRPHAGLDAARQRRHVRHAQPRQGRLRAEPARATARSPTFRVYEVPMTSITVEATKPLGVKPRDAERSKNFFALGLISWMYTRPTEPLHRLDQEALREPAAGARGEHRRVPRRRTTSARPPSCSTTPTR